MVGWAENMHFSINIKSKNSSSFNYFCWVQLNLKAEILPWILHFWTLPGWCAQQSRSADALGCLPLDWGYLEHKTPQNWAAAVSAACPVLCWGRWKILEEFWAVADLGCGSFCHLLMPRINHLLSFVSLFFFFFHAVLSPGQSLQRKALRRITVPPSILARISGAKCIRVGKANVICFAVGMRVSLTLQLRRNHNNITSLNSCHLHSPNIKKRWQMKKRQIISCHISGGLKDRLNALVIERLQSFQSPL